MLILTEAHLRAALIEYQVRCNAARPTAPAIRPQGGEFSGKSADLA